MQYIKKSWNSKILYLNWNQEKMWNVVCIRKNSISPQKKSPTQESNGAEEVRKKLPFLTRSFIFASTSNAPKNAPKCYLKCSSSYFRSESEKIFLEGYYLSIIIVVGRKKPWISGLVFWALCIGFVYLDHNLAHWYITPNVKNINEVNGLDP